MKILHTSDWHLGRSLYGRKRYDEFSEFLNWLLYTIENEEIDALLVAGDIFDTSTPANRAQELYYRFLCRVSNSCCRNIIVTSGNHDSPSFLNAPKELLRFLNVYVVASATETLEDEIIILNDEQGSPEAVVCAVPYLRDKDIRTVAPGETLEDKNTKLIKGLRDHYADVCDIAEKKKKQLEETGNFDLPIIAMGHLFTAGGRTGDGVRELYVGSLAHVGEDVFPSSIDYLALGHLHVPQKVGTSSHIRYSGSPIPMGFGEAGQQKKVIVVEFNSTTPSIHELNVPCFQPLENISGSMDEIAARLMELKANDSNAWVEIEYTDPEIISDLRERLDEIADGSSLEIRRINNKRVIDRVLRASNMEETLDDLDPNDVFQRCLDAFDVSPEDRTQLTGSYHEILKGLQEEDKNAE